MIGPRVYLDHNATTPLDRRAADVMTEVLTQTYGNPSSIHAEGRRARQVVERARAQVAALIGGPSDSIVFTSGGTEADVVGIAGLAQLAEAGAQPRVIAVPGIEHPAVLGAVAWLRQRGWQLRTLAVDGAGRVDCDALDRLCGEGVSVVAVALANHETGTVQPLGEIVRIANAHGARVHADGVQAAGKRAIDAVALGVDTLAISAHKLYGPKGVGALYVRSGIALPAVVEAGHQERERRPGTENTIGIAGFGAAAAVAAEALATSAAHMTTVREHLERGLDRIAGLHLHARDTERVANTTCVHVDGVRGDTMVAALDLEGFAISAGAACTSGTSKPSPVLLAMGCSDRVAVESIRISIGRDTTTDQIDRLLGVLPAVIDRARRYE